MKNLINIEKAMIGKVEVNSVNSRDIYTTLEIKQRFGNWITKQIKSLGLEENVDYLVNNQKVINPKGGRPEIDYIITLETAKHIAMASRTPKGKEIRNYFIQIEKEFLNMNCMSELKPNLDYVGGKVAHIFHTQNLNPTAFLNVKLIKKLEEMFGAKNTREYYSKMIGIEIDETVASINDNKSPIVIFVKEMIISDTSEVTSVPKLYEIFIEWMQRYGIKENYTQIQFSREFSNATGLKSFQKRFKNDRKRVFKVELKG